MPTKLSDGPGAAETEIGRGRGAGAGLPRPAGGHRVDGRGAVVGEVAGRWIRCTELEWRAVPTPASKAPVAERWAVVSVGDATAASELTDSLRAAGMSAVLVGLPEPGSGVSRGAARGVRVAVGSGRRDGAALGDRRAERVAVEWWSGTARLVVGDSWLGGGARRRGPVSSSLLRRCGGWAARGDAGAPGASVHAEWTWEARRYRAYEALSGGAVCE